MGGGYRGRGEGGWCRPLLCSPAPCLLSPAERHVFFIRPGCLFVFHPPTHPPSRLSPHHSSIAGAISAARPLPTAAPDSHPLFLPLLPMVSLSLPSLKACPSRLPSPALGGWRGRRLEHIQADSACQGEKKTQKKPLFRLPLCVSLSLYLPLPQSLIPSIRLSVCFGREGTLHPAMRSSFYSSNL